MKRLPEDIKKRIVKHLACFRTPAYVADLIAEEFDVTLTPRHMRAKCLPDQNQEGRNASPGAYAAVAFNTGEH